MQKGAAFVRRPGVAQTETLRFIERFTVPENAEPRAFDPELLSGYGCVQAPQASGVFPAFKRLPELGIIPERSVAISSVPPQLPAHRDIMLAAGFEVACVQWDTLLAFLELERRRPRFLSEGAVGMYFELPERAIMAVHILRYRDAIFLDNPVFRRREHLLTAKFPAGTRSVVTGLPAA